VEIVGKGAWRSGGMVHEWEARVINGVRYEKQYVTRRQVVALDGHVAQESRSAEWTDPVPAVPPLTVTREQAEALVAGEVLFSELVMISPNSEVFTFEPTPVNPCWIVYTRDGDGYRTTVVDAVTGMVLGNGVPPPSASYAMSGPQDGCPPEGWWVPHLETAAEGFKRIGYEGACEHWVTAQRVCDMLGDPAIKLFHEIAHGGAFSFWVGCDESGNERSVWTRMILEALALVPKLPFAFLGSCDAMDFVDDVGVKFTTEWALRKGLSRHTVVIGYFQMSNAALNAHCWEHAIVWQVAFYGNLASGMTVGQAYDAAMAEYPMCSTGFRLAGDRNCRVPYRRSFVHATTNKTEFSTDDTLMIYVDLDPVPVRFYPFIRISHGGRTWYLDSKHELGTPPVSCVAGGPFVTKAPIYDVTIGPLRFSGAERGEYVLECGLVDAARSDFAAYRYAYLGDIVETTLKVA
jgi:hypothetical protein